MGESIIDLLGPLIGHNGGVEGSILDMSTIVEESTLWLNPAVYTHTFDKNQSVDLFICFSVYKLSFQR